MHSFRAVRCMDTARHSFEDRRSGSGGRIQPGARTETERSHRRKEQKEEEEKEDATEERRVRERKAHRRAAGTPSIFHSFSKKNTRHSKNLSRQPPLSLTRLSELTSRVYTDTAGPRRRGHVLLCIYRSPYVHTYRGVCVQRRIPRVTVCLPWEKKIATFSAL